MFQPVKPSQWIIIAVAILVMVAVPMVTRNTYLLHVLILTMIFGIFASAWNLVAGFGG